MDVESRRCKHGAEDRDADLQSLIDREPKRGASGGWLDNQADRCASLQKKAIVVQSDVAAHPLR